MAPGDNPLPLLLVEEAGLGYAGLAGEAAHQWAGRPAQDFSDFKLVMSKGSDGLDVRELLHTLSLSSEGRRAILVSLSGASLEVQNALLKTLEEPPPGTWIIVIADSGSAVLSTVRSRCSVFQAQPLPQEDLATWASAEGLEVSREEVALAGGNPGRLTWISENRDALAAAQAGKVAPVLAALNEQEKPGPWLSELLAVAYASSPRPELIEARRMSSSGVRPELVLASAFLL